MKTIAVTNLKGGTGKTTSAAYLAHAYRDMGRSVLLVDSDPQGHLQTWHEEARFPMPAIWLPTPNLNKDLPGIVAGKGYDVIIIDTPPIYEHAQSKITKTQDERRAHGIVISAIRAADVVLVPLSALMIELRGIPRVLNAVEEASKGRKAPAVKVTLNRTTWNLGMNTVARKHIKETLGCDLLPTEIPWRPGTIGQSYCSPITGKLHGYLSIAMDLEKA